MLRIYVAVLVSFICLQSFLPAEAFAHRQPASASQVSPGYESPGTTLLNLQGKGKLKVVLRQSDWKWLNRQGKVALQGVAKDTLRGITRRGSKFRRQLKSRSIHVEVGVTDRSSGPDGERIAVSLLILRKNDAKILASLSGAASILGGDKARAQGKAAAFALQSALSQLGDIVALLD